MSEVLKWMALGEMAQRSRIGGGTYVLLTDFDAEQGLRLEAESERDEAIRVAENMAAEVLEMTNQLAAAERQVGELRRGLDEMGCTAAAVGGSERDLQAKLDKAMGLLRKVDMQPSGCTAEVPVGWWNNRADLLLECMPSRNTTSTEGKDHE